MFRRKKQPVFGTLRTHTVPNRENVEIVSKVIRPNELPSYDNKLDLVFIFEVLEHVPDPPATAKNIFDHMAAESAFVENFIKHENLGDQDGADLLSARKKRDEYIMFLKNRLMTELKIFTEKIIIII